MTTFRSAYDDYNSLLYDDLLLEESTQYLESVLERFYGIKNRHSRLSLVFENEINNVVVRNIKQNIIWALGNTNCIFSCSTLEDKMHYFQAPM